MNLTPGQKAALLQAVKDAGDGIDFDEAVQLIASLAAEEVELTAEQRADMADMLKVYALDGFDMRESVLIGITIAQYAGVLSNDDAALARAAAWVLPFEQIDPTTKDGDGDSSRADGAR